MKLTAILLAMLFVAVGVAAQEPECPVCLRIPKVDAAAGSRAAAWSERPLLDGLYNARDGKSADSTRVWLGYDDERLYFRFEVCDTTLHITPADSEKEVGGLDRAELFFSVDEKMSRYYSAEMSPYNVLDYSGRYYRHCDESWDFGTLEYGSQVTGRGYSIEGSVELSELESLGILSPDGHMRLGIFRGDRIGAGKPFGWYSWIKAGTSRPDFHIPASQGMAVLVDF